MTCDILDRDALFYKLPSVECKMDSSVAPVKLLNNSVCHLPSYPITPIDYLAIFLLIVILLITISTLLPKNWIPIHNNRFLEFWSCFDLTKNTKSLVSSNKNGNILGSLYAIRYLSQCCIVWYHFSVIDDMMSYKPSEGGNVYPDFFSTWHGAFKMQLALAVDTFFMIGGTVLTYNCLKNEIKLNLLKYYLHRYLRLTPPLLGLLVFVTIFSICSLPQCSTEPVGEKNCENYWWINLLYINNFIPIREFTPLAHTWYIACDWQLFVFVSPFVVTVINKKPQHIYKLIALIFIASLIYSGVLAAKYDLPAAQLIFGSDEVTEIYFLFHYQSPLVRAGPWAVGLCLGVVLHDYNKNPIKLTKTTLFLCWSACALFITSSIFLVLPYIQENVQPNVYLKAAFITFDRNVFAIGVAWIVFACSNNIGGPIEKILGASMFEPLGKLSYSMYLIHMPLLFLSADNRMQSYISPLHQVSVILGIILVCTGVGLLMYLTFEAPFMQMDRLMNRKDNTFKPILLPEHSTNSSLIGQPTRSYS